MANDKEIPVTHHALIQDLAETFDQAKNVVFAEQRVGSWFQHNGVPQTDLLVMNKSYTKPHIRIYEVKASVSDAKGDLYSGKYRKYLDYCDRLYFALGPNAKAAFPFFQGHPVGVMVRGKSGWKTMQPAPFNKRQPLTEEVIISLLISDRRVEDLKEQRRLRNLERAKTAMLREEILDLQYESWGKFSQIAKDLSNREHKLKYAEADVMKKVLSTLREKFGVIQQRYYGGDSPEKLVEDMLLAPLRELFNQRMKHLEDCLHNAQQQNSSIDG